MEEAREGLWESNSAAHDEGRAGYCLYLCRSGIFPLVKYEEQLAQINDYCLYLLTCLEEKVASLAPAKEEGWFAPITWQGHSYFGWRAMHEEVNKGTMLLLLLAFLETSLQELTEWFSGLAGWPAERKNVRNSKVSNQLHQLGQCCGRDLREELAAELTYYDKVRRIRNRFVHSQWDQMGDWPQQFSLAEVIDMISRILTGVEDAGLSAGLIG